MKYFLIALIFIIPLKSHASWSVQYDNGGGSAWQTSISSQSLLKNSGYPCWEWASGPTCQSAINAAYAIDPSPLPTLTGPNATADGLNWPCDWSQFSTACPPPGGEQTNLELIIIGMIVKILKLVLLFGVPLGFFVKFLRNV